VTFPGDAEANRVLTRLDRAPCVGPRNVQPPRTSIGVELRTGNVDHEDNQCDHTAWDVELSVIRTIRGDDS
jgi:hypothetical protein